MEILRHVVLLVHLVGFAVLFGSWVVQAFGQRRIAPIMSWGLLVAGVAGLALAAPWGLPEGVEMDYAKIGTKFAVLIVIGALLGIGSGRQKRTGETPAALFWIVGALTLLNAALAVLWR